MAKKKTTIEKPEDFVNPHAEANNKELPRIRRIMGQLEGVTKMIEQKRHCYEVIHQVRAVAAAVRALEWKILEHHVEHLFAEILEGEDPKEREEKQKDLMNVLKGRLLFPNE